MTEQEYLDASNLQNLRLAMHAISCCMPMDDLVEIAGRLQYVIEKLEKRVLKEVS